MRDTPEHTLLRVVANSRDQPTRTGLLLSQSPSLPGPCSAWGAGLGVHDNPAKKKSSIEETASPPVQHMMFKAEGNRVIPRPAEPSHRNRQLHALPDAPTTLRTSAAD